MDKIIEIQGLKKSYGPVEAVRGIDLYVEPGALFAFLGPNGAGKSTTIDILCTQLAPDAGRVTVCGHTLGREDAQIRRSIGVVFQDHLLDPLLTVSENLWMRGSLYGLSRETLEEQVERAIRTVDAGDFRDRRYGKLSGGQRRRADIARALINRPRLLFLDEPTTGLDPQTRASVWRTIRALQKESGMTIFLTTHYMEEVAAADYVAIIDHGTVAARGTPTDLRRRFTKDHLVFTPRAEGRAACEAVLAETAHQDRAGRIDVPLEESLAALPLLEKLSPHIEAFEVLAGSMDDVFLRVTGREMREDL